MGKKSKSIRTSLVLYLGLGMVVISIVMTVIIGRTVLTNNKQQISKSIITQTEKNAVTIQKQITEQVNAAEAISGMLGGTWVVPQKQRRFAAEQSLRATVKYSSIKSVWAYWLPGMFDHLDEENIDNELNPTGQMKIHYIKDKNNRIKNDIISELTPEEIEQSSSGKKSFVSEPVITQIDGETVLTSKVFAPIQNSIDQDAGVAGVDIILSGLDTLMNGNSIFEGTTCELITEEGNILASSNGTESGSKSKFYTDGNLRNYFNLVDEETGEILDDTVSFSYGNENNIKFITIAKLRVDSSNNYWFFISITPENNINKDAWETIKIIIIAFAVQIILVILIVFIIVTGFTNPLKKSVSALKNISEGDGDLTIRLHTNQKNEIGDMCNSFNKTMDKLTVTIKDAKASSEEMEVIGLDLSESMGDTATAVVDITDSIESIQKQMQEHAVGVQEAKSVVDQIVTNIKHLNENIDEQASSVTESSSSIEQMTANIRSVSGILKNNQTAMKQLEEASGLGRSLIENTASLSERIQDRSQHLQEASSVIKNIANQTNLLAMNAAIEAAHAGESGKGFAVVAGEIRKLAEESNSQGSRIQNELEEVMEIINEVTSSTREVQNQFNTIFILTQTVSEQEQVINEAMSQQNEGGTQIMEAIRHINSITQSVKDGSTEMLEGSKQVSYEMDAISNMTNAVNDNVKSMSEKTDIIKTFSGKAQDCVEKNADTIEKLRSAMNKFKTE